MNKISAMFILSLLALFLTGSAWADDDTRLNTISLKEENGRQEDGGVVGNVRRTCTYDFYRFEIDQRGQMFFKEAATCFGDKAQPLGGMSEKRLVCQLDAALHCNSTMERFPNVSFTASVQGLSVNGSTIAWKDAQQATQLLPRIKLGAETNTKAIEGLSETLCSMVFGRDVVQLKRDGHIASDGNANMALKACTPKFHDICDRSESKAEMVSLAAASKENKDIDARDIENFCKTIPPSH